RGAARVIALDVGYGQLHEKVRRDERVVVLERVNARELRELPFAPELVVADVSFISLRLVLPPALALAREGWEAVVLVKPQFEAGRREGKGGVVRDVDGRRRGGREVAEGGPGWRAAQGGAVEAGPAGAEGGSRALARRGRRATGKCSSTSSTVSARISSTTSKPGSPLRSGSAVRRAAVITHGKPPTIGPALERLEKVAREAGVELLLPDEEVEKHGIGEPEYDLTGADIAVVLGGDGTMLRALQRFLGTHVPVVGVNFGRVGFLASVQPNELESGLARVFSGDYRVVQLTTLDVEAGKARAS